MVHRIRDAANFQNSQLGHQFLWHQEPNPRRRIRGRWAQRASPNINSECLTGMGGRDDPMLKYGGRRLAEFVQALIVFGEVALGWGRRRVLRRPTILRPSERLPS